MVKALGEDGVDNLHDYSHDISKVGRLGAQGLLVDNAVHCVDRLGAHETGQVEGVLLHTLKHGIEDVMPSGGAVQWNKLEKLIINLKASSDSMKKNR